MMKKLYLLIVLATSTLMATAQTAPYVLDENHNGCCGGGVEAGSSFKITAEGQIDSILIYPRHNEDYTAVLSFYKGNGPDADSLISEQQFSVSGVYTSNPLALIRLTKPVPVEAGKTYTFYVDGTPIRLDYSDHYADGTYWDNNGEKTGQDIDFKIYVGVRTVVTGVADGQLASANTISVVQSGNSLSVSNAKGDFFKVRLLNTSGSVVAEGGNLLSLPALAPSVYILQADNGKAVYTEKIVIGQ